LSLLDQFEVQFNELSNGEIADGELSELQPVELAGIVNQEISRIQNELSPSETVEKISISLSSHDYKRLTKFEALLKDGLEDLIRKSGELKRIDSIGKTKIEIIEMCSIFLILQFFNKCIAHKNILSNIQTGFQPLFNLRF
jgi:hypothetical protein